jgi:hypothetical protein
MRQDIAGKSLGLLREVSRTGGGRPQDNVTCFGITISL